MTDRSLMCIERGEPIDRIIGLADSLKWTLRARKTGEFLGIKGIAGAAYRILTMDPRWSYRLRYDEMVEELQFLTDGAKWVMIEDHMVAHIGLWLSEVYGWNGTPKALNEAIMMAGRDESVNPLRDYLNGLDWDGIERLDTWLHDYCGVKSNPNLTDDESDQLHRAYSRLTLVNAVRRALEPGCKVDEMLVLHGKQGGGKSTIIRTLAAQDHWYCDAPLDPARDKDAAEKTAGVWLYEMSELTAVRKSDQNTIKHFLTQQVYKGRFAYAHHATKVPRRCMFIGSCNDQAILSDPTGARRFFCVSVADSLKVKKLAQDVDQLWAEAMHAYSEPDAPTHLSRDLQGLQARANQLYQVESAWQYSVDKWIEAHPHEQYARVGAVASWATLRGHSPGGRGAHVIIPELLIAAGWVKTIRAGSAHYKNPNLTSA